MQLYTYICTPPPSTPFLPCRLRLVSSGSPHPSPSRTCTTCCLLFGSHCRLHTRALILAIISSRGEIRHSLTRKSINHNPCTTCFGPCCPVWCYLLSLPPGTYPRCRVSLPCSDPGPSHSQKEAESSLTEAPRGRSNFAQPQVQCRTSSFGVLPLPVSSRQAAVEPENRPVAASPSPDTLGRCINTHL